MSKFGKTLVMKTAYATGWEYIPEGQIGDVVIIKSALHPCSATIHIGSDDCFEIDFSAQLNREELNKHVLPVQVKTDCYQAWDGESLRLLLLRASSLARSLPNTPLEEFNKQVDVELAKFNGESTETTRLIKQRVGQNVFRENLIRYWGGACAITSVDQLLLLKASHIKPWASCESDSERLNVFNGLLLEARYDALFDAGLISFTGEGVVLLSPALSDETQEILQINTNRILRWVAPEHKPFLAWHQENVLEAKRA